MKKTYIIANWKSNKLENEAREWLHAFGGISFSQEKEIIVCAPYTILKMISEVILSENLNIKSGAQNVSCYMSGSYTGEVYAEQIKEYTGVTIIGHSERRNLFHETNEEIEKKVINALSVGLEVIFCVQDQHTPIPQGVTIVAYEPISAIGSGNPDTPENAAAVATAIKMTYPQVMCVLYGGSVTGENVRNFTSQDDISGVLVGKASLDPISFQAIIQNA